MKKQMEHFFESIQGWFVSRDLYQEMVRKAPQTGAVFVEIGAWKGRSTAFMAVEIENSGKDIDFIVVDHFKGSAEQIARKEPELVSDTLRQVFDKNLLPVAHQLTVYEEDSLTAAAKFADESLDFIMIDGAHDYDSVIADLDAWWPKLKQGGAMGGDDYRKEGVLRAVSEYFAHYNVEQHGGKRPDEHGRMKCWRVTKPVGEAASPMEPVLEPVLEKAEESQEVAAEDVGSIEDILGELQ